MVLYQKQPLADVLQNRCSEKFRNIHSKASVLESLNEKVAGLQMFSCEYCEVLRIVFYRTPPVADFILWK